MPDPSGVAQSRKLPIYSQIQNKQCSVSGQTEYSSIIAAFLHAVNPQDLLMRCKSLDAQSGSLGQDIPYHLNQGLGQPIGLRLQKGGFGTEQF